MLNYYKINNTNVLKVWGLGIFRDEIESLQCSQLLADFRG